MHDAAPLYRGVAEGPADWDAVWLMAADGVRIRAAWSAAGKAGTVFILPGRSEAIEKYGRVAVDVAAMGFSFVVNDWRGQGLADRLLPDRAIGHVQDFADYQLDVGALFAFAREARLPRPWHMLAHSMGGCIGLRTLINGADIERVVMSAPMLGMDTPQILEALTPAIGAVTESLRLEHNLLPGASTASYVVSSDFEGNSLTSDPEHWSYIRGQLVAHPGLAIGGPSLRWGRMSVEETTALARLSSPPQPCLCFLGSDEKVVKKAAIVDRMRRWPGGELVTLSGARHEILMEAPAIRRRAIAMTAAFLKDQPA